MMKEEFEKRVNFSVMPKEYDKIEKKYMDGFFGENLDKDEFCKQWLNSGGIKEVLHARVNGEVELLPVKRYNSDELFLLIVNNLKNSGELKKAENILDYYLPNEKEPRLSGASVLITDCKFDVRANANFGGSEGIYLDCYFDGKFDNSGRLYLDMGTFKTLKDDFESMKTMSELGGILNFRMTEFINQNIECFMPDNERIGMARKQAEWDLKILGDNLSFKDVRPEEVTKLKIKDNDVEIAGITADRFEARAEIAYEHMSEAYTSSEHKFKKQSGDFLIKNAERITEAINNYHTGKTTAEDTQIILAAALKREVDYTDISEVIQSIQEAENKVHGIYPSTAQETGQKDSIVKLFDDIDDTPLHEKSDGIEVESHIGKWYVIDTMNDYGNNLFLLEHEDYGDETACIIVDENRNVVLDDVWNGFDDYLESDVHLTRFISLDAELALVMYKEGYTIHNGYDNPVKSLEEIEKADPLSLKAIDNDVLSFSEKGSYGIENKSSNTRLFVDMDGTLARFHDEVNYIERMYEQGFFENLQPFDEAVDGIKDMLKYHKDVEVFVLSAEIENEPPHCRIEKNKWLDKYLPEIDPSHRIFTKMGEPKALFVENGIGKNDFLWDDYNVGLEQWANDGGTSVKCRNNINHKGLIGKLWDGLLVNNYNSESAENSNGGACKNLYSVIAENKTERYKDITLPEYNDCKWTMIDEGTFNDNHYLLLESDNPDTGLVVTDKDLNIHDCSFGSCLGSLTDYFGNGECQNEVGLELE